MERYEIIPTPRLAETHAVPGSKSYTNRALTIQRWHADRVRYTARLRATIHTWRVKPSSTSV